GTDAGNLAMSIAVTHARRSVVSAVAAVSALGADWNTTWPALLPGGVHRRSYCDVDQRFEIDDPVAALQNLDRTIEEAGKGPAARLAISVLRQIGSAGEKIKIFGGSNHGETDLLLHALTTSASPASAQQWRALLFDSIPATCGPDVHWSYGACASG